MHSEAIFGEIIKIESIFISGPEMLTEFTNQGVTEICRQTDKQMDIGGCRVPFTTESKCTGKSQYTHF